jgi:hypothetical protein
MDTLLNTLYAVAFAALLVGLAVLGTQLSW